MDVRHLEGYPDVGRLESKGWNQWAFLKQGSFAQECCKDRIMCKLEDLSRYKMESLVLPQYHTKYGKFVCRTNIQVLLSMSWKFSTSCVERICFSQFVHSHGPIWLEKVEKRWELITGWAAVNSDFPPHIVLYSFQLSVPIILAVTIQTCFLEGILVL